MSEETPSKKPTLPTIDIKLIDESPAEVEAVPTEKKSWLSKVGDSAARMLATAMCSSDHTGCADCFVAKVNKGKPPKPEKTMVWTKDPKTGELTGKRR